MSMSPAARCSHCQRTGDLRPYGRGGTWVCFGCAMSTPEREADAREQFHTQLEASGPVALIDGTEVGPYPAKHGVEICSYRERVWGGDLWSHCLLPHGHQSAHRLEE